MHTNAILAGVALLLAVPTVYTVMAERASFTEYDSIPRLFEGFTPENIQIVHLAKAKGEGEGEEESAPDPAAPQDPAAQAKVDELWLQRTKDGWQLAGQNELAGVPIQGNKVERDILEQLQAIRRDEKALVEMNADPETMAARGLTAETGILIECMNAEQMPMAKLYRGNDASGGEWGRDKVRGWFVARAGSNDIVLYEPSTQSWYLTVNAEDWIDKKIQEFQVDQVQSFAVRNPEGEVRFTRGKKEGGEGGAPADWVAETTPEGKGAVRQQEVNNLLARFNYVTASRYLGRVGTPRWQQKAPRPDADVVVSATLEDGTRYVMRVGNKIADKNEYYATFEGKPGVDQFLVAIGEWVRQPFVDKKPADFFDASAEAVAPSEGNAGEQAPGKGEEPPKTQEQGGAQSQEQTGAPSSAEEGGTRSGEPEKAPAPGEATPGAEGAGGAEKPGSAGKGGTGGASGTGG